MYFSTANNCIIWYNEAVSGADLHNSDAYYTCSPDVTHGSNGNITNAPMTTVSHITFDSPCRGAGSADYAGGMDIDGEEWADPPSMGCDEPTENPGGGLQVAIAPDAATAVSGHSVCLSGEIDGAASGYVWNFDDGTYSTNTLSVEHSWAVTGSFEVILTAYNADWPAGVSATQMLEIVSAEDTAVYVSMDGDDANEGGSWATAKATIQAGVDAQELPGGRVLVGAGTYSLSAEITIDSSVHVIGAYGPESTIVDGQGSVRCFYLGDADCVVEGLTVTNGHSDKNGGGIYCLYTTSVTKDCIISGNSAFSIGGGVYSGTAYNCTISGNSVENKYGGGGGMVFTTAYNCTITGNSGTNGSGMSSGAAYNCVVWYNESPNGNDLYKSDAYYSCSPDVTHGSNGNITNAPLFVDAANGDYRLAAGSPCIDVGSNDSVVGSLDMAGMPRIAGGVVDMGAYEYQGAGIGDQDSDGLPDDWEQACFSSLDATADGNVDGDAFCNLEEYIAGTDPTDAASCLAIINCCLDDGFTVEWGPSVTGRLYRVVWSDSLTNSTPIVLQDNIVYPQSSYTDMEHNSEDTGFYRVEVQLP